MGCSTSSSIFLTIFIPFTNLLKNNIKIGNKNCQKKSKPRETSKRLIPLYRHFAKRTHDFHRDHRIVSTVSQMLYRNEKIRTLHTLYPHGLIASYGKPYYPYDKALFPLSLSSTASPPPSTASPSLSTVLSSRVHLAPGSSCCENSLHTSARYN